PSEIYTLSLHDALPICKWAPELGAVLDAILLVALRKDPQGRYGTVEQFAEDLEAFLESRPVRARSGNAWYRTRKFLRLYWAPARSEEHTSELQSLAYLV